MNVLRYALQFAMPFAVTDLQVAEIDFGARQVTPRSSKRIDELVFRSLKFVPQAQVELDSVI